MLTQAASTAVTLLTSPTPNSDHAQFASPGSQPAFLRINVEIDRIVEKFGFQHEIIQTEELENPGYSANNPDRCFFCKDELYTKLESVARGRGIQNIVDGSTVDDLGDYRPGRRAAMQHAVRSPLIEVGLSKTEVRELSRRATLPTWDKPASPCLSSRIAYGTTVTIERLSKVDRGEEILREFGFREFRVRHHDQLVRLEIAQAEMDRVMRKEVFQELAARFRELGFKYVTLDLEGFRSGSMNEVLDQVNPQITQKSALSVLSVDELYLRPHSSNRCGSPRDRG